MADDSPQPVQTIKIVLERVGDDAPVQAGPTDFIGPMPAAGYGAGGSGSTAAVDFRQVLAPSSLREVSSILERLRGGFNVGTLDALGRAMNSTVARFAGQTAVAGETVTASSGAASAALAGSAASGTGGLVAAAGAAGVALLAVGVVIKAFSVSMQHVTARMQELGRFDPRIAAANATAAVATLLRTREQARLESPLLTFASAGSTRLKDAWAPFETAWGNVKSAVAGVGSNLLANALSLPSSQWRAYNAVIADVGNAMRDLRQSGSFGQWLKGIADSPMEKLFPALMHEVYRITGNTEAMKKSLAGQAAQANQTMIEELEKWLNARLPGVASSRSGGP